MQRHIKKQQKKLRREKKKRQDKANEKRNRYWYAIYCMGESLFIGVSYINVRAYAGRLQVSAEQWESNGCSWRGVEYIINMRRYKHGDVVHCPKCGAKVDFRLWMSSTKPEFVYDKEDRIKKLPDPQTPTAFI